MSIIFNVFVIYTLFNQVNCRMIDDSFNIFKRITRSLLFPLITIVEFILQVLIIFFGKSIFHVANKSLTGTQWAICLGFSAITFIVSFIAKLIPIDKVIDSFLTKKEIKQEKIVVQISRNQTDKGSSSTEDGSDIITLNSKKNLQVIPVEERRNNEVKMF